MVSVHPDCEEVTSLDAKNQRSTKKLKRKTMNDENRTKLTTSDDGGGWRGHVATEQSDDVSKPECGKNNDGESPGPPWTCALCDERLPMTTRRTFPNEGALVAHQRAKHFGLHLDIKPDWHRRNDEDDIAESTGTNDVEIDGHDRKDADLRDDVPSSIGRGTQTPPCCPICDRRFCMGMDESRHVIEFLPSSSAIAMATARGSTKWDLQHRINPSPSYECSHCAKSFGDVRAQRQHENFCSFRRQ